VRIALFTPFAVCAVLALAASPAGRRLPPRTASWLLTVGAVVAGAGWAAALAMLACTLISRFPALAAEGGWSPGILAANAPVNWCVASACAAGLAVGTVNLLVVACRQGRVLLDARRHSRTAPAAGDLIVVDDPVPTAFALPGSPSRIVVSSSMLRALTPGEQRALLAHERAHLRHHHHVFLAVLQLAAAVNPLLRPVAGAGGFALERWADEEAGVVVADRPLVARAVARAALATRRSSHHALAATGGPVPQRVQALLVPPPPFRRHLVVAHSILMAICCVSLTLSAQQTDQLFDMAAPSHSATSSGHRTADAARLPGDRG
jgi:Zn-dependent protease with chaperone function